MANATKRGNVATVPFGDYIAMRPLVNTAQTFYPNALVGLLTSGYLDKMDDAASKQLSGVVGSIQQEVLSGGSNGDNSLPVNEPRFVRMTFSSIAVGDVGKTVYALDDQTGTLDPSATTYSNVLGTLHQRESATVGVVDLAYGGKRANATLGAARVMAATGAQSLTKYDLNKTIFVPNTAALTLTLPAVADTQAGDTLKIVKSHASDTNAVTLDGNASETIDGGATLATLDAPYDTAELVSTGAAWIVRNRDIA